MKRLWHVLFFALALTVSSCVTKPSTTTSSCIETRGAFDIGSGTTKMKVAQVDVCEHRLLKILKEASEPVAYEADLAHGADNRFSEDVQALGVSAIIQLKSQASELHATRWAGVATAAFRKAGNSGDVVTRLQRETGVMIQVITQEQESLLGYRGGVTAIPAEKALVWDIGGGSQQMIYMNEKGPILFRGQMASEGFKKQIIEKVLRYDIKSKVSPNPLTAKQAEQARLLVQPLVREVPMSLRELFKDPSVTIIGIGGVHAGSIANQVGHSDYTAADLRKTLTGRLGKTDSELGGSYAANDVSNLILVGAMMEQLEISKVHSAKVDLTHGVFTSPEYWP